MAGEHNLRNALAALGAASAAGVDPEALRAPLAAFKGIRRRLEVRGRVAGVTVYDDFAHHPTAVQATLQALRDSGEGRGELVAVFEPRSFTSRTSVFQEQYGRAFGAADRVLIAAAHLAGKIPEEQRLSEIGLVSAIREHGGRAEFVPTVDEIVDALASSLAPGDRVVVLSNGGFGGLHDRLLAALGAAAAR